MYLFTRDYNTDHLYAGPFKEWHPFFPFRPMIRQCENLKVNKRNKKKLLDVQQTEADAMKNGINIIQIEMLK